MAEDYYKTLGVPRDATPAQIQKAYRDLARKYHPDLNPNDKKAKDKFQKVQAAFDVLNDEKKRKAYDQFGPDFERMGAGGGAPRGGYNYGGPMPEGFEGIDLSQLFGGGEGGFNPEDLGSGGGFGGIFEQLRRGGARGKKARGGGRTGEDLQSEITIPFATAVLGGTTELSVDRGRGKVETLSVKIPAGIPDGGKIRLRGQGEPGAGGGASGDILLTVHVAPHPHFTRRGDDLEIDLPITLKEAVLGGKVDVPTPYGVISLRIPPRTNGGARLRVKGRGVKRKDSAGDLYARVQIVLPAEIDDALVREIERADGGRSADVRRELRW